MSEGKIFIRERRNVEEHSKKPRFSVVATSGLDLEIKTSHIRKKEIEQISNILGAEVVYLNIDKQEDEE